MLKTQIKKILTVCYYFNLIMTSSSSVHQSLNVTGHGKRAHFAHYFKIELLVFKGSVDLKQ